MRIANVETELPVVQAGMGGGIAGHRLAAAVADAGGLGTVAVQGAAAIERELAAVRRLTARPVAVNVLLPFADPDTWRAAAAADLVVTFWGTPRRRTPRPWVHQCGSADEAAAAVAAGADAVIAQGVEAGGHVRGTTPALDLLEQVRAAVGDRVPVLLAGGIAEAADVRAALAAGAAGAVAGTRFLLSEESRAHPAYRARLLGADRTVLTELFGAGWPAAPHRVVPNAATARWLAGGERGPRALRALHRALGHAPARAPAGLQARLVAAQRPGSPLLSPSPPTDAAPEHLVDAAPLYAGRTVRRIADVRPAAELVRELAG